MVSWHSSLLCKSFKVLLSKLVTLTVLTSSVNKNVVQMPLILFQPHIATTCKEKKALQKNTPIPLNSNSLLPWGSKVNIDILSSLLANPQLQHSQNLKTELHDSLLPQQITSTSTSHLPLLLQHTGMDAMNTLGSLHSHFHWSFACEHTSSLKFQHLQQRASTCLG